MTAVIVTLPGNGLSRSKELAGAKAWIKQLAGVDRTKTDGFAFTGPWASFGGTVEVEPGTWFLSYIEDRSGSGRLRGRDIRLYRVDDSGELEAVLDKTLAGSAAGWALRVRDEIADLIEQVANVETAQPVMPGNTAAAELRAAYEHGRTKPGSQLAGQALAEHTAAALDALGYPAGATAAENLGALRAGVTALITMLGPAAAGEVAAAELAAWQMIMDTPFAEGTKL